MGEKYWLPKFDLDTSRFDAIYFLMDFLVTPLTNIDLHVCIIYQLSRGYNISKLCALMKCLELDRFWNFLKKS